jgi:protein-arginine kinase activator protein McsA
MIKIPTIIECPRCKRPFRRGKLKKRISCPYCRAYFNITDVKNFYEWGNGDITFLSVVKISRRKVRKIRTVLKKRFDL